MGDGPSDATALEERIVQRVVAALEERGASLEARVAALDIPAETAEACRDGGAAVDNTFDGGADIDEVSALAVAAASGVGQVFADGSGDAESAQVFTRWKQRLAIGDVAPIGLKPMESGTAEQLW